MTNLNQQEIDSAVQLFSGLIDAQGFEGFQLALLVVNKVGNQELMHESVRIVFDRYPEISQQAIDRLPDDIKHRVSDAALREIADEIEATGLRIEDNMRVCDQGLAVTHEALAVILKSRKNPVPDEVKGNDSLVGVGIDRTDGFLHPLSEIKEGQWLNTWAIASILISGANNWGDDWKKDACSEAVREFVAIVKPNLDVDLMLRQSRYDDAALLKLCSYVHDGLSLKTEQAIDHYRSSD